MSTAMTLLEKQKLFTQLIARLIDDANVLGYELTFGEAWRTPEQAALNAKTGKGTANSLHTLRLAVDFNLFINGVFITNSIGHKPLGDLWKKYHSLCRWGGDFGDGNHYSIEHEGRK